MPAARPETSRAHIKVVGEEAAAFWNAGSGAAAPGRLHGPHAEPAGGWIGPRPASGRRTGTA
jgi:hypothetical protein